MRKRVIPNLLTVPFIMLGVVAYALFGVYLGDLVVAVSGLLGAGISFVIGYLLWATGCWAGGDVKLYTALGTLLFGYRMPVGNPIYPIPLTILLNGFLVALPFLAAYFLCLWAKGKNPFYEEIRITEAKEGMIPAELICEVAGEIYRSSSRFFLKGGWDKVYADPRRASGLTRYQVGTLRRLVREGRIENRLRIKRGIPFAPVLAAGAFVTILFGDLYSALLSVVLA